ncbi:MAG: mercury(II) reductase [Chloroflexi bacterium]|nr:mercury(II) reductase [Chloroflexota bacterium]
MDKFDLIIIGGGAAGFAAATRASELSVKAAIVNAGLPLGGTCVNVGCVPTKFLLELASDYHNAAHPRFRALQSGGPMRLDFPGAMAEKDRIVAALRESNYTNVIEGLAIPVVEGRARFVSPREVEVNGRKLSGDKFIIATGSRPGIPPFRGLDKVRYLTSREALSLSRLPSSLIVIGAGPLGLELAQMYARFGTKVTVLARGRQVLSQMEREVADELQRNLEEEGVEIHTGVAVQEVREEGDLKVVTAKSETANIILKGEELLLATGVAPNSDHMGLERAGVELDSRGFVRVDSELRTTATHVWAAGDVVGKTFLETVAAKEGYSAASNALEGARRTLDYGSIPRAVFTDPQVATVGLTEEESMRRHNTCSCRTVTMDRLPRARLVGDTRGLVKMVVDPSTQVIEGVHMVAPLAADVIHEAAVAVKFKLTVDDIIDTVHVFPTMSEAIKVAAQSFRRDVSRMSCCVD